MFDPIPQALDAVSSGSARAFPLVFAAGLLSSVGPCVAPRFMAAASLASNGYRRNGAMLVCSFVAGLVTMYAGFGAGASMLGRALSASTWLYGALALALSISGAASLWRDEPICSHECASGQAPRSGGAFLLGASFALVVSPCCTPLVFAVLTYTSAAGSPLYGSALLGCFALGHALPILTAGAGAGSISALLTRYAVRRAASVVSATLMLALAGYYGVLA